MILAIQVLVFRGFTLVKKVEGLADWQIGKLADWQIDKLADWQIGELANWLIGSGSALLLLRTADAAKEKQY